MYTKPPYTIDEQIEQLKQRGLLIDPKDDIVTILSNISRSRTLRAQSDTGLDNKKVAISVK